VAVAIRTASITRSVLLAVAADQETIRCEKQSITNATYTHPAWECT